jgi:hypothetical protein
MSLWMALCIGEQDNDENANQDEDENANQDVSDQFLTKILMM